VATVLDNSWGKIKNGKHIHVTPNVCDSKDIKRSGKCQRDEIG